MVLSELVINAICYGAEPIRLRPIRQDVLTCEVADASSTSPRLRHARTTDEGGRGLFLIAQQFPQSGVLSVDPGRVGSVEPDFNPSQVWRDADVPLALRI
ncbi:ATP-binding protein [Streptomyces sp. NPDC001940]